MHGPRDIGMTASLLLGRQEDKGVVTRFAPSPTGRLHLGHAFSAVCAHDYGKARGGRFLLRIEDIDPGRCREEFVAGIEEDLRWLGLDWDGPVWRQSARLDVYAAALEKLRGQGLVYPCYCTRAEIVREIAASGAAPHGDGGLVYPGTCRHADSRGRQGAPCWRIDMRKAVAMTGPLQWENDGKTIEAKPERFGDVVLARKDAPASYHLAVTVDDAAQGVTDIVRGNDLFAVTDIHRLLQELLGLPTPAYRHHALVTDATGRRLAKRDHAATLADLAAAGVDPAVVLAGLRAGRIVVGSVKARA